MFSLIFAILIGSLPHKDFFHDLGEMLVKFKSVWKKETENELWPVWSLVTPLCSGGSCGDGGLVFSFYRFVPDLDIEHFAMNVHKIAAIHSEHLLKDQTNATRLCFLFLNFLSICCCASSVFQGSMLLKVLENILEFQTYGFKAWKVLENKHRSLKCLN